MDLRMRKPGIRRILPWVAALTVLSSCAPASERNQSTQELRQSIKSLQQGELIQELNQVSPPETKDASPGIVPSPSPGASAPNSSPSTRPSSLPQAPAEGGASETPTAPPSATVPAPVADPCAFVSVDPSGTGLSALLGCLSDQYQLAEILERAFSYFQRYRLDAAQKPLSAMSESELEEFLASHGAQAVDPQEKRTIFTDAELDELQALAQRRKEALARAADAVDAAFRARPGLAGLLGASSLDRDRLLSLLAGGDPGGSSSDTLVESFRDSCRKARLAVPRRQYLGKFVPVDLLRLFGLEALLARKDLLSRSLREEIPKLQGEERTRTNPFMNVFFAQGDQQGDPAVIDRYRNVYAEYRDKYQQSIPEHPAPDPHAVHVAFMDLGVDYLRFDKLIAPFLGNAPGELQSYDYADDVASPYAPAFLEFKHGTGTMATLLTLISHQAPEVLAERKLDLAEWKVISTRNILAGIFWRMVPNWESHDYRDSRALVENIQRAREPGVVRPDIVSISMVLDEVAVFHAWGVGGILKQAPWLWVMAAGNDGVNVSRDAAPTHGCFTEFPASERDDSRILCVGALVKGSGGSPDRIAGYSNYGSQVDVYAYSTYEKDCPDGTSCATPAITAAAAILKAKFPQLTPRQIKKVIVGSAVTKTLAVDTSTLPRGVSLSAPRTVRVFDTATMMDRAIRFAQENLATDSAHRLNAVRR